ncbi:MAG: hypothetical protein LBF00_00335 [Mycoplasmataceae bacterium]|nr:hypothetical protein [Mycoplasmataceae bacterium]
MNVKKVEPSQQKQLNGLEIALEQVKHLKKSDFMSLEEVKDRVSELLL